MKWAFTDGNDTGGQLGIRPLAPNHERPSEQLGTEVKACLFGRPVSRTCGVSSSLLYLFG